MRTGQSDRRNAAKGFADARRIGGRRSPEATLPEDARDLIARSEKLVYLFPDGFDPNRLIADQAAGGDRLIFDFDSLTEPDESLPPAEARLPIRTFVGRLGADAFAVEVRPRSATIVSEAFSLRRDLLLAIKEHAERCRRAELREDAA